MKQQTQVVKFLQIAWTNAGGDPHSWIEFNQRIRSIIHIVAASFFWHEGDIDELMKLGSWKGRITTCLGEAGFEGIYSAAVRYHNVSAYKEIERHIGRTPIIADNVNDRKRDRLCIGSSFDWKGELVYVTSFNKEGNAVVCCSYKDTDIYSSRKIKHRYVIGSADIKADRKARKVSKHKEA